MCDPYNLYDPYNFAKSLVSLDKPSEPAVLHTFSDPNIRKPKQAFSPSPEWKLKLAFTDIPASVSTKEICEREKLGNDLSHLLMDEETSDVVLVVEGFHFYVHKLILAARSSYFRAMFQSKMKESTEKEITLIDVSLPCFKRIIVYIYTGDIAFASEDLESIVELVGLANKYELKCLLSELSDHMDSFTSLSPEVFAQFLSFLVKTIYSEEKLASVLLKWIEKNPDQSTWFYSLASQLKLSVVEIDGTMQIVKPLGSIKFNID